MFLVGVFDKYGYIRITKKRDPAPDRALCQKFVGKQPSLLKFKFFSQIIVRFVLQMTIICSHINMYYFLNTQAVTLYLYLCLCIYLWQVYLGGVSLTWVICMHELSILALKRSLSWGAYMCNPGGHLRSSYHFLLHHHSLSLSISCLFILSLMGESFGLLVDYISQGNLAFLFFVIIYNFPF